jgi:hypothetical protein
MKKQLALTSALLSFVVIAGDKLHLPNEKNTELTESTENYEGKTDSMDNLSGQLKNMAVSSNIPNDFIIYDFFTYYVNNKFSFKVPCGMEHLDFQWHIDPSTNGIMLFNTEGPYTAEQANIYFSAIIHHLGQGSSAD